MASKPMFTDEEILYELRKLGYEEVPDVLFKHLKEELDNITLSELSPSILSSPYSNITTSPSSESSATPKDIASSSSASDKHIPTQEFESKTEYHSSDKENCYLQSFSTSEVIKRKTLRRVNGESVITEDLRIVPPKTKKQDWDNDVRISKSSKNRSLFESLLDEASTSSISSGKTKSSKTSLTSLSSKLPTKQLRKSPMSKRGVLLPKPITSFNKKSDPVSRYHEYRKYWDTLKNPGEDKRKNIRWAIRDKLLNYDFL